MIAGVRAVLFDAVGTLIRPEPAAAEVYFSAGRQHGSALSLDEIRRRFSAALALRFGAANDLSAVTSEAVERRRWKQVVADVFADVPDAEGELFESLWSHFAQSRHWVVFDDVVETWRILAARGLVIGIASNFDERLCSLCGELEPLSKCERLFYSSRIGFSKPYREFFRAVERELGRQPGQLLLVGDDRENDLDGARSAGWQALLVDRSGRDNGDGSIRSLRQLIELLA